jgi:uncharacterized membrane protein
MNKKLLIVILAIVIISLVATTSEKSLVTELPIHVEVSEIFEVDLQKTFEFGGIPAGLFATKSMNITNNLDEKKKFTLKVTELKDWISFSENYFVLEPKETREIKVTLSIPTGTKKGDYNSILKVYSSNY